MKPTKVMPYVLVVKTKEKLPEMHFTFSTLKRAEAFQKCVQAAGDAAFLYVSLKKGKKK